MEIDRVRDAANQEDSLHRNTWKENGGTKRARETRVTRREIVSSAVTIKLRQVGSRKSGTSSIIKDTLHQPSIQSLE